MVVTASWELNGEPNLGFTLAQLNLLASIARHKVQVRVLTFRRMEALYPEQRPRRPFLYLSRHKQSTIRE